MLALALPLLLLLWVLLTCTRPRTLAPTSALAGALRTRAAAAAAVDPPPWTLPRAPPRAHAGTAPGASLGRTGGRSAAARCQIGKGRAPR